MDHKPNDPSMNSCCCWKRLLTAELVLAAAMGVILGGAAYVGSQRAGVDGATAAVVAFLVCWIPNAVSLLVMSMIRDPQLSVSAMMVSMMIRMAVPMVFIVFLMQTHHWLAGAGALTMVVIFYLVALAVETPLSLWVIKTSRTPVVKVS
jgi:uncharacterized membrane protein